jgi:cation diffusion facilitator family transporter
MQPYGKAIKVQRWVLMIGFLLMGLKFWAYWLTDSVAILTDALESIVNVVAGSITLISLTIAAKPRDKSHPYGHGKAEFISAGIEGSLITLAGIIIYYNAIKSFITPGEITQLNTGLILIGASGVVNFIAGWYAVLTGKKTNSLGITATGKHLMSDAYSSAGLVVGLLLMLYTKWLWLDGVIAILFGTLIVITGYKIIRESIAGIMDAADEALIEKLVVLLNSIRKENWVDLHNLRIKKYGNRLHIDCHLTLPWYHNLHEAHKEVDMLAMEIESVFGDKIELFVHKDGCLPQSCNICMKQDCHVRQHPFQKKIDWNAKNLFENEKHAFTH